MSYEINDYDKRYTEDYHVKVNEIKKKITDHTHDKYITTPEFNRSIAENFAARLA